MIADSEYIQWLSDVKKRFRQSQGRALVKVNAEMLDFYWSIGRDLVMLKAEARWGDGVVKQFAFDMREAFPEASGFSYSNVKYMKQWYLFYTEGFTKLHQLGGELANTKLHQSGGEIGNVILQQTIAEKTHQLGAEFPSAFACVPWRHHVEIISKCKSIDEALFYIGKTIEQGLSRAALLNCIKANLYEHQGKIVNNFTEHLPALQSQLVQEVLKENYDFGFATVGHEIYDECELEDALTKSVTDLLLELGSGFAFVGRQKELIVGGKSRKIDLLFYHIRLRCYVVCELKAREFEPEFAGKLNFYVNAVDELLKHDDENPTIGLLICSDMNKADVQWSFKGISTPMGVATYNNVRIQDVLPTQEQLKERMELLQKELRETKRLMNKCTE